MTDRSRWLDCQEAYPDRIAFMAQHIPEGSSVLDVGAGRMLLEGYLPADCSYTPLDLYPRAPGSLVCDLNAGEWPEGRWDVAVCSGVFEYVRDHDWLLERLADSVGMVIVSYHEEATSPVGEAYGFLTTLAPRGFPEACKRAGFRVRGVWWYADQGVYVLEREKEVQG